MGLDIYAGTLTRYYSHNWKNIVQQLFCSPGITMIVLPAPSLIYLVYSPCGTMSDNLAILPRAHTFFIKRNHCTVCALVISSCLCNAVRLCKSISTLLKFVSEIVSPVREVAVPLKLMVTESLSTLPTYWNLPVSVSYTSG